MRGLITRLSWTLSWDIVCIQNAIVIDGRECDREFMRDYFTTNNTMQPHSPPIYAYIHIYTYIYIYKYILHNGPIRDYTLKDNIIGIEL